MAFNEVAVSPDMIETVMAVTGFGDHALISNALKGNQGNVDTVVNEYLDGPEKFRRKYGWDESAFSSGRDGENTPNTNANTPSFVIHAPVIYGTEQNNFYGAPSRPPSRANNKSPISRLVDISSAEYTTDRPSNRQEEEDQLQRAINESLNTSGIQSLHAFPPPPPPLPQQSGVTTHDGASSVQFGPATRQNYDADEWAMVRLGHTERDPDPSLRARKDGAPVFLRCRKWNDWEKHRIGALLMIYQQIPAVRNALLQTGETPRYGYGNKTDWWQGEPILPPQQPVTDGWYDDAIVSWSDEIHRLMAFLELSDRAYGTADVVARARHPDTRDTGDAERDFFENFAESETGEAARENRETLVSSVEIVAFDDASPQGGDCFGLLDLQIPETFYLDRYLKSNGKKLQELQMETVALLKAYDANLHKEERLTRWVNPQTNKVYDRRVITKAAVRRCHEAIRRIRYRAYWRKHEQASADGEGEYYLPEHPGEPDLLPEEAAVVAHYEAKIAELENNLAEIERVMDELILRERRVIHQVNRKISSLLTVPSADEEWNPTHKYTLRGVVNDMNTVYYRARGPTGQSNASPADGAPQSEEEKWWKVSFKPEDNSVEHKPVTYETVMREACGTGCRPIVVYATDKALEQDNLPLSDALKTFVRLDNRLFKQELLQSNRLGHKRSAGVGDGSQSKRLQRSASMDSIDTNHASAGDYDDDMRDAPFDSDSMFWAGAGAGVAASQDQSIPDLVDIPPPTARMTAPPSYENFVEMETGVSPALAQVSLQDIKNSDSGGGGDDGGDSPPKMQEMQELPSAQLFARRNNNNSGAATIIHGGVPNGTAQVAGEEEPLIDLSDPKDGGQRKSI
ncbi:hypothetical protein MYCTH_2117078 [Thermothelomyces thermophilus ATCC 42464]|uniref:UBA domain-containing protein n=1 Tax=Thermothelomyces thermophilus (strain ATCC 42464 / BCRC 31852 / DSM 1799) TaxID=573729 RepID=G2Q9K4_THET4|nr:uncharacterized protein MYCTH_2117078 [Thermothelomyces thermophilus ATCC 42464]AEO56463.1 hypothetical protein MYCTH_2117078 [Thermothelomyces thermophilus ATCC 42464]